MSLMRLQFICEQEPFQNKSRDERVNKQINS